MDNSILFYFYLFLIVYFLPSIIAHLRDHKNKKYIFFLTLLTSWTFIGWIASFLFATQKNGVTKKIKNLNTEAYLSYGLASNLLKINIELKKQEIKEEEFEFKKMELMRKYKI